MNYEKNPLVGKRIAAVHLASDKKALRFDVEGEDDPIIARAEGGCCSETWIESLDAPSLLIGKVRSVESLSMPEEETETEYGLIQYYGCKVVTTSGICVIDYRNESNGYYGGSLWWPGESYYYGGVYEQNVSNEDWRLIAGQSEEPSDDPH